MKRLLLLTVLGLCGCGGNILPVSPSNFPSPPAGSPDISGKWAVYLCSGDTSCSPSNATYQGTLFLFISQEPAIFDGFQNEWSSVLDGNGTGGANAGTCVVGNILADSNLKWQNNYPASPASIFIDADTDTAGAHFTMQSSDFTKPGLWQASPDCGSGLAGLSGTFQMVKN